MSWVNIPSKESFKWLKCAFSLSTPKLMGIEKQVRQIWFIYLAVKKLTEQFIGNQYKKKKLTPKING